MIEGKAEVEGGKVTYVPFHAKGDKTHTDCLDGIITSWNDMYVLVDYYRTSCKPQETHRENLVWK